MESKRPSSSRLLHDQSKKARLEQDPYPSAYGSPAPLRLGRQVFLSHSGRNKEFVQFLYAALCQRYHYDVAFFDKETLPTAEPVSMENILEEARRSELGVLVLTEDFFMHTRNPMRELEALVDSEVKLLPLFLTMSVEEFKEKERRARWETKWREWYPENKELIIKWKRALEIVSTFSGIEYCKISTNLPDYVDEVVKRVTRIVRPAISFTEEGVCGKDRLCEMVNSMYKKCASTCSSSIDRMAQSIGVAPTSASSGLGEYTLDLVGIHGFSGLGKTTLCRCLCDFFFAEFNGTVCHVDLAESPPVSLQASNISQKPYSRMLHVLYMLTGYNNEFQYFQGIEQVQNLLRMRISSMTDPVFLAIDNILPEVESQEEADFYLSCEFPKGSKIFITSRSENILTNLTSQHSLTFSKVIDYMPKLEFEEARNILVHQIPDLRKKGFSNLGYELQNDLNECVVRCTIHRERYHPVMLKSLAAYVKWNRTHNPDWKERLRRLRSEGSFDENEAWEKVFNVLDNTYTLLSEEAKHVLLELAMLSSARWSCESIWFYPKKIVSELRDLGFIEGVYEWRILDLVVNFSKYKVGQQGANPEYAVVDKDRCIPQCVEVDEDHCNSQYVFPKSVRNVSITRCRKIRSMLDVRHMEELRVLHLVDNAGLQKVLLNRTVYAHLRSLIVIVPADTSLCFILMDGDSSSTPFPTRNTQFMLHGNISFQSRRGSEITAPPLEMSLGSILGCKLGLLTLSGMPSVQSIDVTTCINLKVLYLIKLPGLEFVRCLDNSHLEVFSIDSCVKLSELTFSADNRNLCSPYARYPNLRLSLRYLPSLSRISGLDKSTSLKCLTISSSNHLRALAIPSSCTKVYIYACRSLERTTVCPTSSYPAEDTYFDRHFLKIEKCPKFREFDAPLRCIGSLHYRISLAFETFRHILGELPLLGEFPFLVSAGVAPSICKARVDRFDGIVQAPGVFPTGVERMVLVDAQHIELLISALFSACPKSLTTLSITCSTQGGGCGCGQHPPRFGPLHFKARKISCKEPEFEYHCPQVRDLQSLAQWHALKSLTLSGCTSVEVWPDFEAMTSLRYLDLSNTSLEKLPAGVPLLPLLGVLEISGCRKLSTQELTKVLTLESQGTRGHFACIASLRRSLWHDLKEGIRDEWSVVDAIDALSSELVALFDRPPFSLSEAEDSRRGAVHRTLVYVLYEMWPFKATEESSYWHPDGDIRTEEVRMHIRTKMRGLLCSTGFLSLSLLPPTLPFLDVHGMGYENRQVEESLMMLNMKYENALVEVTAMMGIALVGGASLLLGDYNIWAEVNDALKDSIVNRLKTCIPLFTDYDQKRLFSERMYFLALFSYFGSHAVSYCGFGKGMPMPWRLKGRVKEAVRAMAGVPSVAAELGESFTKDLEANLRLLN